MTEVENLILEHLRHMRSGMDTIREDLREAKTHLGNVENQCASGESVRSSDEPVRHCIDSPGSTGWPAGTH